MLRKVWKMQPICSHGEGILALAEKLRLCRYVVSTKKVFLNKVKDRIVSTTGTFSKDFFSQGAVI